LKSESERLARELSVGDNLACFAFGLSERDRCSSLSPLSSVLLAWGWSHYQDGLQSKRATVVEINNRIKTLGKKASVSTDQAQRQKSLAEARRLLVERRELEKELRPLFQRFLDAFR
jgi:hypothetical protein